MNFTFDFSSADWITLRSLGITMKEVVSVFGNPSSVIDSINDIDYLIGFSDKRKFLIVAYRLSKNPNFDLEVLQVDLPYEKDIKKIWCQFNRS
jgi:Lhr-like helicase